MPVSVFAPIRPPASTIFLLAKPCGGGQSFGAILDLPGHGKAHLGIVFIRDLLCTFFSTPAWPRNFSPYCCLSFGALCCYIEAALQIAQACRPQTWGVQFGSGSASVGPA